MNLLEKTNTYLIGHMQYIDGMGWREKVKAELTARNIRCFDPYDKPFIKDLDEGVEIRARLIAQLQEGNFDDVQKHMKEIRIHDLNLVDRSDFIVAHIIPTVASWGTAEELTTANRSKKPIFLSVEGGKSKCPLWILGMIPHNYIFDSVDDSLHMLRQLDDGVLEMDMNRWRLLKPEYR